MKSHRFKIFTLSLMILSGQLLSQSIKMTDSKADQIRRFNELTTEAGQALNDQNYARLEETSRWIVEYAPKHPVFMHQYARALALNNKPENAMKWLEKILDLGGAVLKSVPGDSHFVTLWSNERFTKLKRRIEQELVPVNNSQIAFTITERDLMSEGVAFDHKEQVLYLGSIYKRKIIAIDRHGNVQDFVASMQDGLLGVIGMEVDEARRHLWVCSGRSGRNNQLGIQKSDPYIPPVIYKYDVDTGDLLKRYTFSDSKRRLYNDLTVSSKGELYVTDTYAGEVLVVRSDNDKMEILSEGYLYPNGITLSDDDKDLFIAHYLGIDKINLKTGERTVLDCQENTTLVFIDGLAFYKNTLITHQATALGGIYQYKLDKNRNHVIKKRAIELYNPLFNFTTTGEISGDTYYYLANAQFRGYHPDGSVFPYEKLEDVIVLKVNLRTVQD